MSKNKSKKSVYSRIRNYFIAGVFVLIPIGITVYLTIFLINISSKLIPQAINPDKYLPYEIPGLEILIALFLITFIGWLSLTFIGKRAVLLLEGILNRIPILRTIYSSAEQLLENFSQDKKIKKVLFWFNTRDKVYGQLVLLLRKILVKLKMLLVRIQSMYLFLQRPILRVVFY